MQAERSGQSLEFVVTSGKLGLESRRFLREPQLPQYEMAHSAFQAGLYSVAAHQWTDLSERTEPETAVWLLERVGLALERCADWNAAVRTYSTVWERLQGLDDTAMQSQIATAIGRCCESTNEWTEAIEWYGRAERIDRMAGRPIWQAASLNSLGQVALERGDLPTAKDYYTRALTIRERHIPDTLDHARSLNNLGNVSWEQGDLQTARHYHLRALDNVKYLHRTRMKAGILPC